MPLVHPLDQSRVPEPLHVVVDALRRLPEDGAHLRARARLRQLPQHLHPLRLEQRLGLLEPVDEQQVLHEKRSLDVKELFVNPLSPVSA